MSLLPAKALEPTVMRRPMQTLSLFALLGLAACGRGDRAMHDSVATPAPVEHEVIDLREQVIEEEPLPEPELDKSLGRFEMTYYWLASEPKEARGTQPIFDRKCRKIAKVTKGFKRRLSLEGGGKLKDGRLISAAGNCRCGSPCFFVADDEYAWGAGVKARPLNPFRSVAVDPRQIKIGTAVYVAELDGLTMPGPEGFVHDGCVVADDRGGNVRGKQIDFFAAEKHHYKSFFKRHKINKVNIFPGGKRCEKQETHHAELLPKRGGQG